jgi:hypothetical protein
MRLPRYARNDNKMEEKLGIIPNFLYIKWNKNRGLSPIFAPLSGCVRKET